MGMVVKTNMAALNSNRALNKNNSTVAKNIEKLSTGMKINRAADDASGLAISEKMQAQIKALDTASANAEDGISLIQTAEGYMGEVHEMLNRMVELAEKSANGTYQLASDGSTGTYAAGGSSLAISNAGTDRAALQAEMDQLATEIDRIAATANFNGNKIMNGNISAGSSGVVLQIGETSGETDKLTVRIDSFQTSILFNGVAETIANTSQAASDAGVSGAGKTINISNQASASSAAESIRKIIDNVSMQRATLGASQNRLEYTISNLNTASENITSANSRIRDTDMAKEMMKYTQANVLTQAAQSMLAQANQAPQQILQLLQ